MGNIRGVAQLGLERGVRDAEVGRSNRLAPINLSMLTLMQTLTKIVVRSQVAITIKLSFDSAKDDVTLRLTDPA